MKIILSRKGFDTGYGGIPSPIMPDGTLLSLPIPCVFDEPYVNMHYESRTYRDIITDLNAKKFTDKCGHVDPDLRADFHVNAPDKWCPIFGQCGAAEGHLRNQKVTIGDIFLFFGWFRKTEEINSKLKYITSAPEIHMIYGYLQIGNIVRGSEVRKYQWHPHSYRIGEDNTMYIASQRLVVEGVDTGLSGAGTFKYSDNLVLTMSGQTKSRWKLPYFFKDVTISYHSQNSWKPNGYFQSAAKGQEFVVSDDLRISQWAKNLIIENYDMRSC